MCLQLLPARCRTAASTLSWPLPPEVGVSAGVRAGERSEGNEEDVFVGVVEREVADTSPLDGRYTHRANIRALLFLVTTTTTMAGQRGRRDTQRAASGQQWPREPPRLGQFTQSRVLGYRTGIDCTPDNHMTMNDRHPVETQTIVRHARRTLSTRPSTISDSPPTHVRPTRPRQ